jgi:hypothetical protein
MIAADAWHNFRSAIDQLIFELAFIDNGGKEDKRLERTMFPASTTIENFRGNHVQNTLLACLTQRHRALVRRFQPYRRTYLPVEQHPLALLDALSNDDKHRLTQPALVTAHAYTFRFKDFRNCHPASLQASGDNTGGVPLKLNQELMRLPLVITGPNPDVKMESDMTVYVGLRNGLDLWGVTSGIGKYCRGIVEVFAPEFERPKAMRMRGRPRLGRIVPREPLPPEAMLVELI